LKKDLYGPNQAPKAWYGRIDSFLMSLGFTKSKENSNLYLKVVDGRLVILLSYVDDLFLTGDEKIIIDSKRNLVVEFDMKDLGMMHYFLGMEVWQRLDRTFLNQGKYAMEILKRFGMLDCKAIYTQMIANLNLLCVTTSEIEDDTI
jgi:superfamily I DNA and/or RNA helicase